MLIGEVARRAGVSTRMLRHYDALGLVQPSDRSAGGYREYSDDDIRRLLHVESLRSLGLSLREVHRALNEPGFAPSELISELIRHSQTRLRAERELLARLEHVASAGPTDWPGVLALIALLRGVRSEYAAVRQRTVLDAQDGPKLGVDALAEALLAEDDPNVAGALRWALAHSEGDKLPVLTQGLATDDAAIRRRAVTAIASIDSDAATAVLHDLLEDSDSEIRRRVILALGARNEAVALPHLIDLIVAGRNDVEAAEFLAVTAAADDATAQRIVDDVAARLAADTDPAARLRLVQALAEIAGPAAHEQLRRLGSDGDPIVARTSAAVLGCTD